MYTVYMVRLLPIMAVKHEALKTRHTHTSATRKPTRTRPGDVRQPATIIMLSASLGCMALGQLRCEQSHNSYRNSSLLRISSPNLSFFLRCLLSISLLSHFLHSILLGLSASAAFHFNIERRGASRLSSTSTSCCSSCFGSGSGSSSGPSHPRPHAFAPLYTHVFHPACLSTQPNLYCTALRCSIVSDCQPILAFVSKAEVCSQLQIVPYSTSTS